MFFCLRPGLGGVLALMLAALFATAPIASAAMQLDGKRDSIDLNSHAQILVDATGRLGLAEITSEPYAGSFKPGAEVGLNFGLTRGVVWVRFELGRSRPEVPGDWVLLYEIAPTASVELHLPDPAPGTGTPLRGGALTPISERPLRSRAHAFPVTLPTSGTGTYYLRIAADTTLLVDVSLLTPQAFNERSSRELSGLFGIGGMYLALALSNLALFAALRERSHIELAALITCVGFFLATTFGLGSLFLWPDRPGFERVAAPLFASLSLLAGTLFARDFMEMRKRVPRLHEVMRWLTWASVAAIGLALAAPFAANIVITALSLLVYCLSMLSGALVLRDGYTPVRMFLVALSTSIVGGLITLGMVVGQLGFGFWTAGFGPLSFVLALVLTTVALGRRITFLEATRAQVFEAVDEAIFVIDPATRTVLERNLAASKLLEHEDFQMPFDSSPETRESTQQVELRGRAGSRWLELSRVDTDLVGQARQLVLARDVTERHEADHTREQLREQLDQVQRMEAIGTLAGGLAHDFNNLLTVILGSVSLVRELPPDSPDRNRYLEMAEKACGQATHLTGRLLTFSKGGAPVREPARLGALLEDAVALATAGSAVRPHLQIEEDVVADIDVGQITLSIQNLLLNAVQAMPLGGHVQVRLRRRHCGPGEFSVEAGEYAEIEVQDEGTGIAPEHLRKVFEPYFTTKQHGSGLGLSTTYSVVHRHGGLIDVRSELGSGTTFRILLAVSHDEPAATTPVPTVADARPARVLVMDDEDGVRATALKLLEILGHEAQGASDGREALETYRTAREQGRPFDLVLLDLTVPGGMGGLETLEALKAIDPDVRAVVSSGYANDPVMAGYRAHGFQGMLPKPYAASQMRELLFALLGPATEE